MAIKLTDEEAALVRKYKDVLLTATNNPQNELLHMMKLSTQKLIRQADAMKKRGN